MVGVYTIHGFPMVGVYTIHGKSMVGVYTNDTKNVISVSVLFIVPQWVSRGGMFGVTHAILG